MINSICQHTLGEWPEQVKHLYRSFPSQGDIGYQFFCKKCQCYVMCACKKSFYLTFLPHYFEKFKETVPLIVSPRVCRYCRFQDLKAHEHWIQNMKFIEYIFKNDKAFFDYCYGTPISGYEKDHEIRFKNIKGAAIVAEARQQKARKLINQYLFKTVFD